MDENLKGNDRDNVLMVYDKNKKEMTAAAANENGEITTVPSTKENGQSFLKINGHAGMLENFFSNFMRQLEDPAHLRNLMFFKVPLVSMEESVAVLKESLKNPDDPANKAILDMHRVEPDTQGQKQSLYLIAESRIDWQQLEAFGVTRETLERSKCLDDMLAHRKSPVLLPIAVQVGNTTIRTQARLSFREREDGSFTVAVNAIQKEPALDRPYFGVTFTEQDKENLRQTGNLGRVVTPQYRNGEPAPVYLSVDKLTNELVALRADNIRLPGQIKGVTLDQGQKQLLSEGKAVYLEGMASKNGKPFNAHVQVNAEKRGLEFIFDNNQRQNLQKTRQETQDGSKVRIPEKLLGAELSAEQQAALRERKTVYVSGMKDKAGAEFNAYVKIDEEKGKLGFYKWNPDKAPSKKVTPDNASKTQVAVNSEGKTNEATKKTGEPLKKGQTAPDSENRHKKKSTGVKM